MELELPLDILTELGLDHETAEELVELINSEIELCVSAEQAWAVISKNILTNYAFPLHLFIFNFLFPNWQQFKDTAPAFIPTANDIATANISHFMAKLNIGDIKSFHQWTITDYETFWEKVIQQLNIIFAKPYKKICDLSKGVELPNWLVDAEINIVDSCFNAPPSATAILYENSQHDISKITFGELNALTNQIANSLKKLNLTKGDQIALILPMSLYAVATYLAIIKIGGVVVSIPDSFSSEEMATRLMIASPQLIVTQDFVIWDNKKISLYEKVCKASATKTIVIPYQQIFQTLGSDSKNLIQALRTTDQSWSEFLVTQTEFSSVSCDPMQPITILFSSGTSAEPKAIPWNHTTPIKAASDAFFHQNIQRGDVLAWPTNLGWMMGPWLVFAALINQSAIALYHDAPKNNLFGKFIEKAKVTMLGVVPTIVSYWRQTKCMEEGVDFSHLKVLTSTGECSKPEDMLYLMSLAQYQPIIEYCGGTEIGGAYVSSTVIENNYPSLFSTATMGTNFIIIDKNGQPTDIGEVAIIPPTIGLSTTLLNANHHQVYFDNMPIVADKIVRRHGDQIQRLDNGYYILLGRIDDAMNLSGIKISATEIERVLNGIPSIKEIAAIAISAHNGPSLLVIYAVSQKPLEKQKVIKEMQTRINLHLNPLFKIYDVVFCKHLPRTASNKIMRRELRKMYQEKIRVNWK